VVIDQHFEQRNRYGRLLSLVAQSPSLLGLGVDEDTAAVIHDDGTQLEVVGRGAVIVIDGQHLISNAFAAKRTTPLLMSGAVIHILPAGSEFDLTTRSLVAHQTAAADPEVLEARAEADLRNVVREVAAEDASPAYQAQLRRNGRR
jgi:cyanophycinase